MPGHHLRRRNWVEWQWISHRRCACDEPTQRVEVTVKGGSGFHIDDVRATLTAEAGRSGGGEGEREGVVCFVVGSKVERAEARCVRIGAPNIFLCVGPGVTVGVSGFGGSAAFACRVEVGKAPCGVGGRKAD